MKNLVKFIFEILVKLFSYKLFQKFEWYRKVLNSMWISKEFKTFGEKSLIGFQTYLTGMKYISIGDNVKICNRVILTAWDSYDNKSFAPSISIGDGTFIGEDAHITAINKIEIEKNVLFGKKVTVTDNSHGSIDYQSINIPPLQRELVSKGFVKISENVWLGDKVTILPNVIIGKNSIVAANSVVTKDVPENVIVAGIPAKIIKIIEDENEK